MRWVVFLLIALFMGIQTLRASESEVGETRIETHFLRVSCQAESGRELTVAFFPEKASLSDVMKTDSEHWAQVAERCLKKSRHVQDRAPAWTAQPVVTSESLGGINDPCSEDRDCKPNLSCEPVSRSCIPQFRISNLPLTY